MKAAIAALEPRALRRLRQFARRGVTQLQLAGESVASDEHEQILHDAITDTMTLVVHWNRQLAMELHLFNVIRRRVSNQRRRAGKRGEVSLDVLAHDEHDVVQDRGGEPEAALGRAQVTRQLYELARERAAEDPEVLLLLDAYRADVTERPAVMARTGMQVPTIVNARRRLDRLLAGLPAELRSAALAAMWEVDIVQVGEITRKRNI